MYGREDSSSSFRFDGDGYELSSSLRRKRLERILEHVRGRLRDAIQRTVLNVPSREKQDRCFLPRRDLDRILDSTLLAWLFRAFLTNNDLVNLQEDIHGEPRRNSGDAINVDEVVGHCVAMTLSRKALLALFLYQEHPELLALFVQWVKSSGHDAPYDHSMPLSRGSLLDNGVPEQFHDNIIRDQHVFTPVTILDVYRHSFSKEDHLHFIAGRTDVISSSSDTVDPVAIMPHQTRTRYGHPSKIANISHQMATALQDFQDKRIRDKTTTGFEIELEFLKDLWTLVRHSVTENDEIKNLIARLLILELPHFSLAKHLDSEKAWATTVRSLLLTQLLYIVDAISLPHDLFEALNLDIKPNNILVVEQEGDCFEPQEHGLIWDLCDFGLAREFWGRQRANNSAHRSASKLLAIMWLLDLVITPAGTYRGPWIQEMASRRAGLSSDVSTLR